MTKNSLLFVEKLANNSLLASFSASISEILAHFSLATGSRKGLKLFQESLTNFEKGIKSV